MFQGMTEREEERTKAHEKALEVAVTRINRDAGDISGIMEALTMTSLSLQEKLVSSKRLECDRGLIGSRKSPKIRYLLYCRDKIKFSRYDHRVDMCLIQV